MPKATPLRQRLLSRLIIDPDTGCLLWAGSINNRGYGRVNVDGRVQYVHRLMYEMFVGPIPDGLQLDHVKARGCVNRHCASPAHLEPVTARENQLRADGFSSAHAAVTRCPAGHEYDLLNTYWRPNGSRVCRACNRERMQRARPCHDAGAEDWDGDDE